MIIKIPKKSITRIEMLYDPDGRTMEQWHRDYGFSYAINTVLFDLDYTDLAGYLTIDNKVLCQKSYPYGFASDGKKLVFSYGNNVNYPDFAGFAYATLVRDGEVQVGYAETKEYGYRERSAVGLTKDGDIVLLCDRSNRSLPGIAGDMQAAGCVVAGNYDGGGSSSMVYNGNIINGRPVMAILAIWTDDESDTDDDNEEKPVSNQKIVCIDPGHGWTCCNGSPDGNYKEHEFALDVANRIKAILTRHGVKVVMTRTDGTDVSLSQRAVISNNAKADLFLSIHSNAAGDGKCWNTAAGWEAFVVTKGYTAEKLAEAIRKVTIPATAAPDRGIKEANYTVLVNTSAPAVLVEHGFHTNQAEVEKLKDSEYRQLLAECDAQGVLATLGIAYVPTVPTVPQEPWYTEDMKWAVENCIMDGTRPTEPATRAEVVAMLRRAIEK